MTIAWCRSLEAGSQMSIFEEIVGSSMAICGVRSQVMKRVLQECEFERVGSSQVDVRVIATIFCGSDTFFLETPMVFRGGWELCGPHWNTKSETCESINTGTGSWREDLYGKTASLAVCSVGLCILGDILTKPVRFDTR
jgi:hypothetical protein